MTITTEEAEKLRHTLAVAAFVAAFDETRRLAAERDIGLAERDIANEQVYGLAEERERWKDRAEAAEAETERMREALAKLVCEVSHDASLAIAQGPAHKPRLAAAYDAASAALDVGDGTKINITKKEI